jgi:hypothetical protein
MNYGATTSVERDVAVGRYRSRFMAEADIIASAGTIIREADDDTLRAIINSTKADGRLWGAIAMAERELLRRKSHREALQAAAVQRGC